VSAARRAGRSVHLREKKVTSGGQATGVPKRSGRSFRPEYAWIQGAIRDDRRARSQRTGRRYGHAVLTKYGAAGTKLGGQPLHEARQNRTRPRPGQHAHLHGRPGRKGKTMGEPKPVERRPVGRDRSRPVGMHRLAPRDVTCVGLPGVPLGIGCAARGGRTRPAVAAQSR
jgi:hypothetical protein